MPVNSTVPTYTQAVELARTIRDAVIGESAIKKNYGRYLSPPNRRDIESSDPQIKADAVQRYEDYVKYAVWTGVTGSTHSGYMGALFRKEPEIEIPSQLEYVKESVDGSGKTITDLAKQACSELLQAGLFGILIDYPQAPTGITVAQRQSLNLRPRMLAYPLESIINWQTTGFGGSEKTTIVVLKEVTTQAVLGDEFAHEAKTQYRVLRLRETGYTQQLYSDENQAVTEEIQVLANGQPMPAIPFVFVGSERNEPTHQTPPLSDIATLNIAHFRNSADHEESLRVQGNPTLVLTSDLSVEQWKMANPEGVSMGSRRGHFLGANGSAQLLQMTEVSALERAMQNKIEAMQQLGARLTTQAGGTETAEAARIRASAETAVLDTIAGNVSAAITMGLIYMAAFEGIQDVDNIEFSINREFFPVSPSPQEITVLKDLAAEGLIPPSVVYNRLRQTGIIPSSMSDDEIEQEMGDEIGQQMTQQVVDREMS